ncbi:MAG: V-type ATPase subunit [Tissierellia bacterium]|nr:V-type ATPase subunit [Tissierellia bacterium]
MKHFYAASAKIHGMAKDLLKDEDFYRLSECERLEEFLVEVKKFPMGKELNVEDSPFQAEVKLQDYREKELKKPLYFYNGPYRLFIKSFLDYKKMEEIKRILRILQKKPGQKVLMEEYLKELNKYHLNSDANIPAFIENLKGTKYYKVLKPYEDEEDNVILFYMEMNLDRLYYQELMEIAKDFSKGNEKAVAELLGQKIDLLNIISIYRGLKYYQLLPEELVNFVIRGGYRFHFDELQELCYSENEEDLIEKLSQSHYYFLFEGDRQEVYMDRRKSRYLHYLAKDIFRRSKFSFGKYIAYQMLFEDNLKDLVTLMETTRFQMEGWEKRKFLIRSYKGSDENSR